MSRSLDDKYTFSRRTFLQGMRWSPLLFLPAPMQAFNFPRGLDWVSRSPFSFSDFRISPHYPARSPLEDVLRQVAPGQDQFITEKYAAEIMPMLSAWSEGLKKSAPALSILAKFLDSNIEAASLVPTTETPLRAGNGIEAARREFTHSLRPGRETFLQEMKLAQEGEFLKSS